MPGGSIGLSGVESVRKKASVVAPTPLVLNKRFNIISLPELPTVYVSVIEITGLSLFEAAAIIIIFYRLLYNPLFGFRVLTVL
jgi:hypothetical protein